MGVRYVRFGVEGVPVPQGSKNVNRKTGTMFDANATELRAWRKAVRKEAEQHRVTWIRQSPLVVHLAFGLPTTQTQSHGWAAVKPDIDKLERAVLDGLVDGRVLIDDAQVVGVVKVKLRARTPGVLILVKDARTSDATIDLDCLMVV